VGGKFNKASEYFNFSYLWNWDYRFYVLFGKLTNLSPEIINIFSLVSALVSCYWMLQQQYLLAAIFIHLKDSLDAADGALARITNKVSSRGRFLDSNTDFIGITSFMITLGYLFRNNEQPGFWIIMTGLAWFSLFMQCSYYNFYQVAYAKLLKKTGLTAKNNESLSKNQYLKIKNQKYGFIELFLRGLYSVFYGWQDILINRLDKFLIRVSGINKQNQSSWYKNRIQLTLNSLLVFGNHLMAASILLIIGKPQWILFSYVIVFNAIFLFIIFYRILYFRYLRPH